MLSRDEHEVVYGDDTGSPEVAWEKNCRRIEGSLNTKGLGFYRIMQDSQYQ